MWASQDRDPVERAARNFCFGLKKVFKEEWNIPYNVKISEQKLYTMTVGGELALTAHVSPMKLCMNGMEGGQIGMNFIQVPRRRCCLKNRRPSSYAQRRE